MHFLSRAALLVSFALATATTSPAGAQDATLQRQVQAALAAAPAGTRFGLVVAGEDGREIVAINPDQRFIPASNTKLLTTAAAYETLAGLDQPDVAGGAAVRLDLTGGGPPDVILRGYGDARLSSAADCVVDCLAVLADAVAARTRAVRNVVGDESLFPDQRWSPGMSWNNIQSRYGTAASALTLDDNELTIRVTPGAPGQAPALDMLPYYTIDNRAVTVAGGRTDLSFERMPMSRSVRISGTIAAAAEPQTLRLSLDDPAHFAAWRFKSMLEARGVRVGGEAQVRRRALSAADDPARRGAAPAMRPPEPDALARLTPPPLTEDIADINKTSQNLHAELMLRRVGLARGTGSIADGVAAVAAMMERAGVPRTGWDISDGSGMSTYNRMAPRAIVTFLRWAAARPWGAAWRESLPIAGVDGTLSTRFRGTPLERRLFAKTGSLNATHALSGYFVGRSGRTFAFSFYANDVPDGASATAAMDAALQIIAAAN
ncbi:MAG TPA: D-alanyl-D-alanine carboxypeptidase/D-alanyl-D-alanine-endopeptidase [Allosphingosinicella sp.]|jgi:D-alanyl-D-alanine carboxypeptidase/D-alanyl-D-alanine-endopeptidase (penicillin-binding protein 4)